MFSDAPVGLLGVLGDRVDGLVAERELDVLGLHQRCVLAGQRVLGLGQDAHEVVARERVELDADREAPLQLRNQVGDLRDVERARGDEQHVVGPHRAVLGVHGRALDDRQQIALHALARHVRTVHRALARDLVDLVDEHDPRLLAAPDRLALDLFRVEQLLRLFVLEHAPRLADRELAPVALAADAGQVAEHVAQLELHVLEPLAAEHRDERARALGHLDLHELLVELARAQPGAHLTAVVGGRARRRDRSARRDHERPDRVRRSGRLACGRIQQVDQALFRPLDGAHAHLLELLGAHHLEGRLDQVAHDRVDVAPDVADLGELRGLDLHERRLRELGEPPRDLGLTDAGRADHDDVLRDDLVAQLLLHLLPSPAVAQRDRDRALGLGLADDVAVELADDLSRREGGDGARRGAHPSSSTVMDWLV